MQRLLRSLLPVFTFLITASAYADVTIVSARGFGSDGTDDLTTTHWLANKFITAPSGTSFELTSVKISMGATTISTGGFVVSIYGDNGSGTAPGSLLQTLSGSSNFSAAGTYQYVASSLDLNPNTIYWMVQEVTSGTAHYHPSFETTQASITTNGWNISGIYTYTANAGSTWGSGAADGPSQYSLLVVPEPADYAMILGVAGLAVVLIQRRRHTTVGA